MCYIGSSFLVLLILAAFRSTAIYFGCAVAVGLIFFAYLQPLLSKVICVTSRCCMLECENKKRGGDDRVFRPCIEIARRHGHEVSSFSLCSCRFKARAVPPPLPVGRAGLVLFRRVPDRSWWQLVALDM